MDSDKEALLSALSGEGSATCEVGGTALGTLLGSVAQVALVGLSESVPGKKKC